MDSKIFKPTGFRAKTIINTYRIGHWIFYNFKVPVLRKVILSIYRIWDSAVLKILFQVEIPAECQIGPGLNLSHYGSGVIIHPKAVIGTNVTIYHQVTIGSLGISHQMVDGSLLSRSKDGAPIIGDRVLIGAGAKIIGPVHIGNNARIGANAVVVHDIPENATVVGIPAKVL